MVNSSESLIFGCELWYFRFDPNLVRLFAMDSAFLIQTSSKSDPDIYFNEHMFSKQLYGQISCSFNLIGGVTTLISTRSILSRLVLTHQFLTSVLILRSFLSCPIQFFTKSRLIDSCHTQTMVLLINCVASPTQKTNRKRQITFSKCH